MLRRSNRLPLVVLASFTIILLLSCTQSPDILTPVATTDVALSVERLPSLPAGMAYQLWVAKAGDTVSLGRFLYDADHQNFEEVTGEVRSDSFALKGDILNFTTIFVSVERIADPSTTSPGPIMLIDNVSNTNDSPIRLRFPKADSLWLSVVKYNMQTPTDLDRDANIGSGLWFTRYQTIRDSIPDTIGQVWTLIDSVVFDTSRFPFIYTCGVQDTANDSAYYNLGGSEFLYMSDTLPIHHGVKFTQIFCVDSIAPFEGQVLVDSFPTVIPHIYIRDWYNQQGFILPDIHNYGWHYKGWIVTPYLNSVSMTSRWRLTKPAYRYNTPNESFLPGDTGVLFTTGSFDTLGASDFGNPFSLPHATPPFPGEDFLDSTALMQTYGISSVQFLPDLSGSTNTGTVFLSIEPDNFIYDTTNFPLIAMAAPVPARRTLVTDTRPSNSPLRGVPVEIDLNNYTSTVPGNTVGFPVIGVTIKRF